MKNQLTVLPETVYLGMGEYGTVYRLLYNGLTVCVSHKKPEHIEIINKLLRAQEVRAVPRQNGKQANIAGEKFILRTLAQE